MTSAETDYLLRLATLSLSFVGFSAVVVTLRGALGGRAELEALIVPHLDRPLEELSPVEYAVLLLGRSLPLLFAAQAVFGLATGLLYYSSLFYSMDVGETKCEHGGIHEAAIGLGICLGPAVGAGALFLAPAQAHAGAYGVTALLFPWVLRRPRPKLDNRFHLPGKRQRSFGTRQAFV